MIPTAPVDGAPTGIQAEGSDGPATPVGSPLVTGSCGNIAPAPCDTQIAAIAARHPGAVEVDIQCGAMCTRESGSGTATVILGDGTTLTEAFTYGLGPSLPPDESCTGIPADTCPKLVALISRDANKPLRIAAVQIECRIQVCSTGEGEAAFILRYEDGSAERGVFGWSAPVR